MLIPLAEDKNIYLFLEKQSLYNEIEKNTEKWFVISWKLVVSITVCQKQTNLFTNLFELRYLFFLVALFMILLSLMLFGFQKVHVSAWSVINAVNHSLHCFDIKFPNCEEQLKVLQGFRNKNKARFDSCVDDCIAGILL